MMKHIILYPKRLSTLLHLYSIWFTSYIRQNHDVPKHPHSLFSLGICRFSAYESPRAYGEACVPFGGNVDSFFFTIEPRDILDDQSDQSPKKRNETWEDIHGDVGGSSSHQGFLISKSWPIDLDEKRGKSEGKMWSWVVGPASTSRDSTDWWCDPAISKMVLIGNPLFWQEIIYSNFQLQLLTTRGCWHLFFNRYVDHS